MVAISVLGIWKGIGWSMMIFLAALQGVPRALEEAATVDGAGRWQRFRAVTLPAIRPAIGFVTVMLVIGGFNVFISVYLMTGGGPAGRDRGAAHLHVPAGLLATSTSATARRSPCIAHADRASCCRWCSCALFRDPTEAYAEWRRAASPWPLTAGAAARPRWRARWSW